jgi:hypothetical protein
MVKTNPWQLAEKPVLMAVDVIPAQAGIQYLMALLDSRLRGSDTHHPFWANKQEIFSVPSACLAIALS